MSKISWFDEKRLAIQSRARDNLLYYQLAGEMSVDELCDLADTVEEMNNVNHELESDNEEFIDEVSQAMAAEVVWTRDEAFINSLIKNAADVDQYEFSFENALKAEEDLIPKILGKLSQLGSDGQPFIITNPLMLSVLQSIRDHRIAPVKEGFKGPNNTLKALTVDGVDTYAYIYGGIDDNSMGKFIMGWYIPEEEKFVSSVINVVKEL